MNKGDLSDGVVYHAGFPNAAEDQRAGGLSLDDLVVQHRASTFFWRLSEPVDEKMWAVGTILVVDRALSPRNDDVVVVVADEVFRLVKSSVGGLRALDGGELHEVEIAVWGVVTFALQGLR